MGFLNFARAASIGAMGGGKGGGRWGQLAAGIGKGSEQQRYTQADFDGYTPGGDYGAAPEYDWQNAGGGGWGRMTDAIQRGVAGMTPGGMENYNRRHYIQQQMDLKDPQMSSLWQGRDDWQKNPEMTDQMWGDINNFYGNEKSGGAVPAVEGAMGQVGGAIGAAKGAIKKTAPGHKPGKPQRTGMAKKIGAAMDPTTGGLKGSHSEIGGTGWAKLNRPKQGNIGQMAQASRTSSYGG